MKIGNRLKMITCMFALSLAPIVSAAIEHATGTVAVMVTYANFGNGDFTFRIANPTTACFGYWISPTQPGFKSAVAFVMQARASGEPVLVGADSAQTWTGSGENWCKVDYVGTPY